MRSFTSRLLTSILFTIFIVFLVVGVFINEFNKKSFIDSNDNRIKQESQLLVNVIENQGGINSIPASTIKDYANTLDVQITLLDQNGKVIINEGDVSEKFPNYLKQIEASNKDIEKKENTHLVEVSGNSSFHFYHQSLSNGGYLFIGTPLTNIESTYKYLSWVTLISLLVAFFIIFLISYKLIQRHIRPIEFSTKVAVDIANGNYHARTYEDRMDETGILSASLNKIAKNMQEIVRAQEVQEDRLGTLIESIGSGLLLIDSRGYINLINKSYKDLFSVRSTDYLYKQYYKVIPYREVIDLAEEIFMTENKVIREMKLDINSEKKSFQVYGVPIIGTNDKWMGILIVFNDITELKKLEQIRKDFVANVSHELKTPITSIKGFSETLLDGAMENQNTLEEFLRIILKESDRMQTLVQDLLDLSKLEQHHFSLNKERFNIIEVLNKATKMLEGRAASKNIELNFYQENDIISIEGDRSRLTQVFLNLISNAVSYTPNNGKVNVSVIEKKKKIDILIKDTGIGIEQEEIHRIFERFYRVDKARSRNSGGTGLGLAIVKHLIEIHKGIIKVDSKVGEGTTFTVTLNKEFPF